MQSTLSKELKYLRQRLEILDKVIAGLEELAPQTAKTVPNLRAPHLRLYKCVDGGSTHGSVRGSRRSATLGKNFG
jgi:hypothetical protein